MPILNYTTKIAPEKTVAMEATRLNKKLKLKSMEKEIVIFGLFLWWSLGVAILFGSKKFWAKFYAKIPAAALSPNRVFIIVFLFAIVLFPLVFLAPLFWIIDWFFSRRIRTAAKRIDKIAEGKSPELADELKKLAENFRKIADE